MIGLGWHARHRELETLLDVADDIPTAADAGDARAHLRTCHRCARQLTDYPLITNRLRRWADVRAVEPPPDAWSRLRDRVARDSGARRRRTPTSATGALLAPLMVTAVVLAVLGSFGEVLGPAAQPIASVGDVSARDGGALATSASGILPPADGRRPVDLARPTQAIEASDLALDPVTDRGSRDDRRPGPSVREASPSPAMEPAPQAVQPPSSPPPRSGSFTKR
ncbi:MAG TPA: hypothetical protein VGQ89_08565 [Candidatus Limnocylindrales bacterium]|nr:hypothetical protein [Candidatus Limnocylindrales bacterium]